MCSICDNEDKHRDEINNLAKRAMEFLKTIEDDAEKIYQSLVIPCTICGQSDATVLRCPGYGPWETLNLCDKDYEDYTETYPISLDYFGPYDPNWEKPRNE